PNRWRGCGSRRRRRRTRRRRCPCAAREGWSSPSAPPRRCARGAAARTRPSARERFGSPWPLAAHVAQDELVADRADTLDLALDDVAVLEEDWRLLDDADAQGGAGGDEVARLERDARRDVLDDLGD